MNKKRGSVAVFLLPGLMMIFLLELYVLHLGRLVIISQKTQNTVDAWVLSLLNIRAISLAAFSEKQQPLQTLFEQADVSHVRVPASSWPNAEDQARQLKNALSGYKGRQTAAITVLADANQQQKSALVLVQSDALNLGLQAEGQWIVDGPYRRFVSGLWYKKMWPTVAETYQPKNQVTAQLTQSVDWWPAPVQLTKRVTAGLVWEGSSGVGGYPGTWNQGLKAGKFHLSEAAYYRAQLLPQANENP